MSIDLGSSWARRWFGVAASVLAAAGLLMAPAALPRTAPGSAPAAGAEPCPDVEVIFARGRTESPGAGRVGNAFISALRSKVDKNVSVYAVNYPADTEVDQGANDMSRRIQHMAATCPDTRLVIGGYSLGAAVTDVVLAAPISAFGFNSPLPPGMDQHIAAVALFGNGAPWIGGLLPLINPAYATKTIEKCHGADPVCVPAEPETWADNWGDHSAEQYISSGMVNEAADFVASKL